MSFAFVVLTVLPLFYFRLQRCFFDTMYLSLMAPGLIFTERMKLAGCVSRVSIMLVMVPIMAFMVIGGVARACYFLLGVRICDAF